MRGKRGEMAVVVENITHVRDFPDVKMNILILSEAKTKMGTIQEFSPLMMNDILMQFSGRLLCSGGIFARVGKSGKKIGPAEV